MDKYKRRKFLEKGALLTGGLSASTLALTSCSNNNENNNPQNVNINSNKKFKWRIVTTWPPNFPVLGEAVISMAKDLEVLSSGRLNIKVYGAGELVPAFECFDAVTQGAAQMAHGVAYYWAGKIPSAVFFAAVPFGLNAQQMNSWLLYGGGWELWKELYAKFNLIPFPCGNTGVQMGGWFNKEIKTIKDISGLKMRIPGLGGKVFAKAGGSAVTVAGGEVYTNLERGVIDAAEWIGPYHDYKMGFHKVSKYYYYPGWHEPGSTLELFCNKTAYDGLPIELQEMITSVALKYNTLVLSEFEAKNNFYLQKILEESNIELKQFPEEVLMELKKYSKEVLNEITKNDPFANKVYKNFSEFKGNIKSWHSNSEKPMGSFL